MGCLAWDDADLRFFVESTTAKTGSFAALTRRLDFAVCAAWFAAAVFLHRNAWPTHWKRITSGGGPFIPPWLLHSAQQVVLAIAITACGIVPVQFFPDVSGRETPQSGEAGAAGHDELPTGGTAITA